MKRAIEIKSIELLSYGSELTDKIQHYISCTSMILNVGRINTRRFIMSDNAMIFIHHTERTIIVEKA